MKTIKKLIAISNAYFWGEEGPDREAQIWYGSFIVFLGFMSVVMIGCWVF